MSGYLKIVAAAIIWGSLGPIVRVIDLPVLVIVFFRVLFAALTIFAYIFLQNKTDLLKIGKNVYPLIIMGALLALNWTAFFFSVNLTSIANAVLITYTAPIFVAALAPLILKEKLERITIYTLSISMVGIALITSPSVIGLSASDLAGLAWAFVSAITYVILVMIAKPMTARVSVLAIIFYEELTSTIILSPALFIYDFRIGLPLLLVLFILGAVQTALAAGLYLSGLRQVKAQQAGVITYLDPVSAIILAAIFLGETPGITTLFGGVLIIASGLILVLATRRRVEVEVVSE